MITYKPYHPSDAHGAVELWNAALGESFPIDLRLWRQNVDNSSHTLAEASLVVRDEEADNRVVGLLIIKSPRHICVIAVDPKYQRQGIGTEMIAMAKQSIGSDTDAKWVFGADYNHFFPGLPIEFEGAASFFEDQLGFKRGGISTDLVRDLADYEIPPAVQERIGTLAKEGIEMGPCRPQDLTSLADHLSKNFGHRWLADTVTRLNVETNPSEIIVARRTATGEVIGFAHTYSFNSRYIGPPIYWRPLLGPKYGGLGPIGVAEDVRKIGLGMALLAFAVQSVKDRGATRMAIDWTGLVEFYGKIGFVPWKQYISLSQ